MRTPFATSDFIMAPKIDRESSPKPESPRTDVRRERKPVDLRADAHRRWVGGDDDDACRGID